MTRTETRRMIELEAMRDSCRTDAAREAWHAIHGAELAALHAAERADIRAMLPAMVA